LLGESPAVSKGGPETPKYTPVALLDATVQSERKSATHKRLWEVLTAVEPASEVTLETESPG